MFAKLASQILIFFWLGFVLCEESEEALIKYYQSLPRVDYSKADANKTDVIYKLYRNVNQTCAETLSEETVKDANLDATIPTILIFHGWSTDDTSPWYEPLKEAYFKSGQYNIIYINWSKSGNKTYEVSSANILPIGKYIAEFLIASSVPPSKIHLVGHSLGAQLCGFVGKAMIQLTGKKIGRITALDPAGPMFENLPATTNSRLCADDAEFVDVIHTDIQFFGYTFPLGHVDFYPNGGRVQPGCPSRKVDDNCSHARSTLYFIESISTRVTAKEAILNVIKNRASIRIKDNGKTVTFGQHVDLNSRGVFYLETDSRKPFLRNETLN